MSQAMTVVGAGVTGLVAAIEAAERGWEVILVEGHAEPGGRARTLQGPFRANTGPHAISTDGALRSWLQRRHLVPPVVAAPAAASNLVHLRGRLRGWPAELGAAIAALPAQAPAGEPFRSWLGRHLNPPRTEAVIGLVFIATYDHDPGRLSAAFAHQCLRRLLAGGARYVTGGWSTLVDLLCKRAADLGVRIRTQTRMHALPSFPTTRRRRDCSLRSAPPRRSSRSPSSAGQHRRRQGRGMRRRGEHAAPNRRSRLTSPAGTSSAAKRSRYEGI